MSLLRSALLAAVASIGITAAGCDKGGDDDKQDVKTVVDSATRAQGEERGECYPNNTCNDGLQCLSGLCVKDEASKAGPSDKDEAEDAPGEKKADDDSGDDPAAGDDDPAEEEPPAQEEPPAEEEPASDAKPAPVIPDISGASENLLSLYEGAAWVKVNRVSDNVADSRVIVKREKNGMLIVAATRKGDAKFVLDGYIEPISKKEFKVVGKITGQPMFIGKLQPPQETKGTFTFRQTKNRPYWRMYDIDGKDCVCGSGCGNEFCYIDIGMGSKSRGSKSGGSSSGGSSKSSGGGSKSSGSSKSRAVAEAAKKCKRGCNKNCKNAPNKAKCVGQCRRACDGKR